MVTPTIDIGGRLVGASAPAPYVLAEVASAHEGDLGRIKAITAAAVEAGADCVKYQIWSRRESFTADHPQYEVFGQLEFSPAQWLQVMDHARSLGIGIAVDVDDLAGSRLAVEGGAELLKIRTANLAHGDLLRAAAESGLPIVLATGASTLDEVGRGLAVLDKHGAAQVMVMHGFQAFPTAAGDTHLRALALLKQRFGRPVGYADHADGGSPLACLLPAAALAAGACAVEKHITLDREKRTEDYESSLNGPQFKAMVEQLRQVWQALGEADHALTEAENRYRVRFKKCLASSGPIASGQTIRADMLAFKVGAKPGIGLDRVGSVVGRTAAVNIAADTILEPGMIR